MRQTELHLSEEDRAVIDEIWVVLQLCLLIIKHRHRIEGCTTIRLRPQFLFLTGHFQ